MDYHGDLYLYNVCLGSNKNILLLLLLLRQMMCMTVLHGGVWQRTPTPHKSGNKMKKKNRLNNKAIREVDKWRTVECSQGRCVAKGEM